MAELVRQRGIFLNAMSEVAYDNWEYSNPLQDYNYIYYIIDYYTLCKFLTLSIHFIGQATFVNFN
jgi:hypothetical protein